MLPTDNVEREAQVYGEILYEVKNDVPWYMKRYGVHDIAKFAPAFTSVLRSN